MMRVIVGADHGGYRLKQEVLSLLQELGMEYKDVGTHSLESVDYPDYAEVVGRCVAAGEYECGILICGTGIGMSIAANKIVGVRCAVVSDPFSAQMSREHNNANILAIGERVVGTGLAKEIVKKWITAEFQGDRHEKRVMKIHALEGTC